MLGSWEFTRVPLSSCFQYVTYSRSPRSLTLHPASLLRVGSSPSMRGGVWLVRRVQVRSWRDKWNDCPLSSLQWSHICVLQAGPSSRPLFWGTARKEGSLHPSSFQSNPGCHQEPFFNAFSGGVSFQRMFLQWSASQDCLPPSALHHLMMGPVLIGLCRQSVLEARLLISKGCHLLRQAIFPHGPWVLQCWKLRNLMQDMQISAFDSSISDLFPCFSTFHCDSHTLSYFSHFVFCFIQQTFTEPLLSNACGSTVWAFRNSPDRGQNVRTCCWKHNSFCMHVGIHGLDAKRYFFEWRYIICLHTYILKWTCIILSEQSLRKYHRSYRRQLCALVFRW